MNNYASLFLSSNEILFRNHLKNLLMINDIAWQKFYHFYQKCVLKLQELQNVFWPIFGLTVKEIFQRKVPCITFNVISYINSTYIQKHHTYISKWGSWDSDFYTKRWISLSWMCIETSASYYVQIFIWM